MYVYIDIVRIQNMLILSIWHSLGQICFNLCSSHLLSTNYRLQTGRDECSIAFTSIHVSASGVDRLWILRCSCASKSDFNSPLTSCHERGISARTVKKVQPRSTAPLHRSTIIHICNLQVRDPIESEIISWHLNYTPLWCLIWM